MAPKKKTERSALQLNAADTVLDLGLDVISRELQKLRIKSEASSEPLPREDGNALVSYVRAALGVVSEQREAEASLDPSSLSDGELVAATERALRVLKGGGS